MKFEEVYGRRYKHNITCEEASDILGIGMPNFLRRRYLYQEEDFQGCSYKISRKPVDISQERREKS